MGSEKKIPAVNARMKDGSINGRGVDALKGIGIRFVLLPAKRPINSKAKSRLFERKNTQPALMVNRVYT